MRFGILNFVASAILALAAQAAIAAEITVTQKGKSFDTKRLTIKAGDVIKFVNPDEITHNIHSRTKGHQFDLGAQKPNSSLSHSFSTPGKIKVRCAIHPKMKITVVVK